ncbi:iron-containing alcohol dehydrogenase [Oceanobacillus sp. CF4.6]|uniref:iron-containing alcohol dehydrogenase n=1 Tax=Oceanobacillus sp. CF4.6 TaxID=3373080 RepID=UPI003EE690DF
MMYQFLPVDRVHYGLNIVEEKLISEIQRIGGNKAVIVTTKSLLKTNVYNRMVNQFRANGIEIFTMMMKQHVPGDVLMQDIKEIKDFEPNLIISCGGGSAIDSAKILSLILAENIDTEEELYTYSQNIRGNKTLMENYIPHFAIPTTLSAAEFTSIAGTTNKRDLVKYKFHHLNMTPQLVFLDPTFTMDTPEWLWLSTGMRAVDHAVETQYTPIPSPVNEALALAALKKLYQYLPLTKQYPDKLEYRLQCQIGAWLSLFSVDNIKLGLSHSIGHQLGAMYNIPHGITSAIMLPSVMEFLLPRAYDRLAQITDTLSVSDTRRSIKARAEKAPIFIKDLVINLEIPHKLSDFNVAKETIPDLIENILIDIKSERNEFVINTKNLELEVKNLVMSVW